MRGRREERMIQRSEKKERKKRMRRESPLILIYLLCV